eukprot:CAMPEP_0119326342 /NCGR_PEP_ID=MMETSP1333-20130426/68149_1 /TAXON_ID=418940 /ORGANISM="Scyphosphaera apsteinii, Strain RCC1455" /LENGTH=59 /DNA_ID=CAMNT_0007334627 /DNA_START=64 /DNA_END=240 /DNA_ORIENTATION=-
MKGASASRAFGVIETAQFAGQASITLFMGSVRSAGGFRLALEMLSIGLVLSMALMGLLS